MDPLPSAEVAPPGGRSSDRGEDEPQAEAGAVRPRRSGVRPPALGAWSRFALIALASVLVVRTFVVEAFKIPTASMENTLLVGDYLLVNKLVYGAKVPWIGLRLPSLRSPTRGDVVVFNPPHEPNKNYVKRLVGVPGDTLRMEDKQLLVNGRPVDEPFALYVDRHDAVHSGMRWQSNHLRAGTGRATPSRDNWGPLVVPRSKYFVLGDNRDNSEDSRYWGFVDGDAIRGRPWIVYYSYDPTERVGIPWLEAVRWSRVGTRIR